MVTEDVLRTKRAWRNPEESALKSIHKISMSYAENLPPTAREMELFPNALAIVVGFIICASLMVAGCHKTDPDGGATAVFVKTLRR